MRRVAWILTTRKLCLVFACLLFAGGPTLAEETVREVSEIEAEDHQLVQHLYKDKRYRFAKEEGESYLKSYPTGFFRAGVLFILAQIAVIQTDYAEAQIRYEEIIANHRDSPFLEEAFYYGGTLCIRENRAEKGKFHLLQLREKFPDSAYIPKTDYLLGKLAFNNGQWQEAENYLQSALEQSDPPADQKRDAQRLLAWSYHFQGKREPAIKWFVFLLHQELDDASKARICYQLGVEAYKDREYRKAVYWHERQMKQWPDETLRNKSRFWIAEALYALHRQSEGEIEESDRQKAIDLYGLNLSAEEPVEPLRSRLHRAWLYLSLRQNEKAEQEFEALQKSSPKLRNDSEVTLARADLNYKMERWKKAFALYALAQGGSREYAKDADIMLTRVELAYRLERWPEAILLMRRLAKLAPEKKNDFWFLTNFAKASEHMTDRDTYGRWKRRMPKLKPIGHFVAQATRYYESAYRHAPANDAETRLSLLAILVERQKKAGNYPRAVALYKETARYVKEREKAESITLTIAKLYLNQLQDSKNAAIWLRKLHAKGNGPVHFEASSLLYSIALQRKEYQTATTILLALSQQPIQGTEWYIPVHFKLAELYQIREKWQKAVQHYGVVARAKGKSPYRSQAKERRRDIQQYLKEIASAAAKTADKTTEGK